MCGNGRHYGLVSELQELEGEMRELIHKGSESGQSFPSYYYKEGRGFSILVDYSNCPKNKTFNLNAYSGAISDITPFDVGRHRMEEVMCHMR